MSKRIVWTTATVVAALLLAMVYAAPAAAVGGGTVTVKLIDSQGNPLNGAEVRTYYEGTKGSTGGTSPGVLTFSDAHTTDTVYLKYGGHTVNWASQNISSNPTLTAQTTKVVVDLKSCSTGQSLASAPDQWGDLPTFKAYFSGSITGGSIEILPGTDTFYVNWETRQAAMPNVMIGDGGVNHSGVIGDGATQYITFYTSRVTLFGNNIKFYNNAPHSGFHPFTSPMEMLQVSWNFTFDGVPQTLNVSGCSLTGGILTLVDEVGNPLANYPADYPGETRNLKWKYRCGGSWGPTTSFQTDANGQTFYSIDCSNVGNGHSNWDNKITMTLNQTTIEQNVSVNSVFQAAKVNANLKSCTSPITDTPGGSVDQGGGYWYHHDNTGPSGTVTFYTFPGNIKLRMSYNHNSLTLYPTIVAGTNEVDFQTTSVTLNYSGDIKSNKGGSWWMFSKPTMDLLPGDYNFWFKNGSWAGPYTLSVSGCDMSEVLLRVLDENGNGVAGAKATPAYGGSWGATLPGVTDVNGTLFTDITPGFTKISLAVNQGSEEQSLAQLTASNYTWYTEILRIWLNDHSGSPITDQQAVLRQGGGYWYTWGNLNASGYRDIQLFARPAAYKFEMNYNYTSDTQFPVVSAGPGIDNFYFQTGQVFGSCITQYSTGAWRTFTDGMELMPGTYTFRSPSQSGTVTAGGVTNLSCP